MMLGLGFRVILKKALWVCRTATAGINGLKKRGEKGDFLRSTQAAKKKCLMFSNQRNTSLQLHAAKFRKKGERKGIFGGQI